MIMGMLGDPGVEFSQGAAPPNLPGANNVAPPFQVTAGFLADSDAGMGGVQAHGVNPGETLGILYDLQAMGTYQDIIDELTNGDLRIGIHLQSIGLPGGSESFVNNPVPIPAAIWLMIPAMGFLARSRARS